MKIEKIVGIGLVLVLVVTTAFIRPLANNIIIDNENDPPFLEISTNWADSVLKLCLQTKEQLNCLWLLLIRIKIPITLKKLKN